MTMHRMGLLLETDMICKSQTMLILNLVLLTLILDSIIIGTQDRSLNLFKGLMEILQVMQDRTLESGNGKFGESSFWKNEGQMKSSQ